MTSVDRRHVEALAAIEESGTITAAAARLFVSQPTLSRTLAQLESIVGVRLVDRSTHHLEITEAGRRFLPPARASLASLDEAVAAARTAIGPLRLGYAWATNDVVAALVAGWEQTGSPVSVTATYDENPMDALLAGAFDVIVTRDRPGDRGRRSVVLLTEQRHAALPRRHPLAGRDGLELGDLAAETIVLSGSGTTHLDLWPPDLRPADVVTVGSVEDWLTHIAAGHGIGVTVESIVRSRTHADVVYVPLTDAPHVDIHLLTLDPPSHPSTPDFLAQVVERSK